MALSAVVPSLQLHHVGLDIENLADAVLEVVFAAAVPVTVAGVLELEGRNAHHEVFVRVPRGSLERAVYCCRHGNSAFFNGGPGVPVEHTVNSTAALEEVGSRVVDFRETGYDQHIAYCLLELVPSIVANFFAPKSGQNRLSSISVSVLHLEVRGTTAICSEIGGVIKRVFQNSFAVIK